jgi:hypothetical protein
MVISHKLPGTQGWFLVHHTHCGMETFTDEVMRGLLAQSLNTATADASGWHDAGGSNGSTEGEYLDWLTIRDAEGSTRSVWAAWEPAASELHSVPGRAISRPCRPRSPSPAR